MNEFTLITTYYNNKDNLLEYVDGYLNHKKVVSSLKLIIVDDGSQIIPASSFLSQQDIPDCSLYRVTEDLGFNSHGARNLAMMESTTEWNVLLDSDVLISSIDVPTLANMKLNLNTVYGISINGFLINKQQYFSCKGYDEEFVNIHYGDRFFIQYLKKKYNYQELNGNVIRLKRSKQGAKVIYTKSDGLTKYDYENNILYQPTETRSWKRSQISRFDVEMRYHLEDFSDKQIINFPWEKIW